jgi:hypothetical protein
MCRDEWTDKHQYDKDMTLMEAFAFEAIFHYLLKSRTPLFESDFKNYSLRSLDPSMEMLLSAVRIECYEQMSRNEDLKHDLLKYYSKNRNNLNLKYQKLASNIGCS